MTTTQTSTFEARYLTTKNIWNYKPAQLLSTGRQAVASVTGTFTGPGVCTRIILDLDAHDEATFYDHGRFKFEVFVCEKDEGKGVAWLRHEYAIMYNHMTDSIQFAHLVDNVTDNESTHTGSFTVNITTTASQVVFEVSHAISGYVGNYTAYMYVDCSYNGRVSGSITV